MAHSADGDDISRWESSTSTLVAAAHSLTLTAAPALRDDYPTYDASQSDIVRMLKYEYVCEYLSGAARPLRDFCVAFERWILRNLRWQSRTMEDLLKVKLSEVEGDVIFDLDAVRNVAFNAIVRRVNGPDDEWNGFITKIERNVRSMLQSRVEYTGEDGRFNDARRFHQRARDELARIEEAYPAPEQKRTLAFVNGLLLCRAYMRLVYEAEQFAYHQPPHSTLRREVGKFGRFFVPWGRNNSLAKARDWEGTGADRISARKAAIYRINSV